jgi:G3E family GTPase
VPETEEYGVSSFVYRARRPFAPAKLHAFFNKPWPGVIRAKGFFWLATRPAWVGELSQAGALVRHEAAGYWWAAVPKAKWPEDEELRARIDKAWHTLWGDRRQELVFIGVGDMDKGAIVGELDECLLSVPESGPLDPKSWTSLEDPFPSWQRQ